jgi:hypothetical protein
MLFFAALNEIRRQYGNAESFRRDGMEIFIKIAPRAYDRLRSHVPIESAAHEAIENASRIDHSIEGVLFAGYSIACSEEQARVILEIARQCCPEIVPDVEQAMTLARSGS